MAKPPRNIPASVRARLLNLARQTNQPFDVLLTRFVHERLLYRLSLSPHAEGADREGRRQPGEKRQQMPGLHVPGLHAPGLHGLRPGAPSWHIAVVSVIVIALIVIALIMVPMIGMRVVIMVAVPVIGMAGMVIGAPLRPEGPRHRPNREAEPA